MPRLELDHVFICADDPAAAELALMEFGLRFDRRRVHEGQGTSNACVLFENAYLELLYRHRDDELRSALVSGLGLWERVRWRETGACPFGIALREAAENGSADELRADGVMSAAWMYRAAYLPPGVGMPIVTPPGSVREPMVFVMPRALRPTSGGSGQHRHHDPLPLGMRMRLDGVVIEAPSDVELSPGVRAVCAMGLMTVRRADEYAMRLTWCAAAAESSKGDEVGSARDFRPLLPLVIEG